MTMLHEKCKISHIVLNINNIQEYVFCKRDCFKMYIADYVVHVKSELKVITIRLHTHFLFFILNIHA